MRIFQHKMSSMSEKLRKTMKKFTLFGTVQKVRTEIHKAKFHKRKNNKAQKSINKRFNTCTRGLNKIIAKENENLSLHAYSSACAIKRMDLYITINKQKSQSPVIYRFECRKISFQSTSLKIKATLPTF